MVSYTSTLQDTPFLHMFVQCEVFQSEQCLCTKQQDKRCTIRVCGQFSQVLITKLRSTSIQFSLTVVISQFCSDDSTSVILDWQWKPFKIALVRVVSYPTLQNVHANPSNALKFFHPYMEHSKSSTSQQQTLASYETSKSIQLCNKWREVREFFFCNHRQLVTHFQLAIL